MKNPYIGSFVNDFFKDIGIGDTIEKIATTKLNAIQKNSKKKILLLKEKKNLNSNLYKAAIAKNDEFYTQYEDIEKEVPLYKEYLKDKIIYCNCDNPEWSNFYKYFKDNFKELGIKKLITTHYNKDGNSYKLELSADNTISKRELDGNGDFRNEECIKILKESDIVISNPPFSLFREYIKVLIKNNKQFLIVGSQNNVTYKEMFEYIRKDKVWTGVNGLKEFKEPCGNIKKFGNICWYTNLDHKNRYISLELNNRYKGNESNYKRYDNYGIINIDRVKDIPFDYKEEMGVPITYIFKHNPKDFQILGLDDHRVEYPKLAGSNSIDGKKIYRRIIIKRIERF